MIFSSINSPDNDDVDILIKLIKYLKIDNKSIKAERLFADGKNHKVKSRLEKFLSTELAKELEMKNSNSKTLDLDCE